MWRRLAGLVRVVQAAHLVVEALPAPHKATEAVDQPPERVAVVEHHDRPPARHEHAVNLLDALQQVARVVEAPDRVDVVERPVLEWQLEYRRLSGVVLRLTEPREPALHHRDRSGRDVGAVVLALAGREQLPERAEAEADLEHLLSLERLGHILLEVRVEAQVELVEPTEIVSALAGDPRLFGH